MSNKCSLDQKQSQKLVMTTRMRQAIYVMKLPLADLNQWLDEQILSNPLIELDRISSAISPALVSEPVQNETLIDFLRREFVLLCSDKHQRQIAETVCGFLDENGFLTSSYQEIATVCNCKSAEVEAIANKISQLDPPGLATLDACHSLLAQLTKQGKQKSVAYTIIKSYWKELLENNQRKICSILKLSQSQFNTIVEQDIRPLNPYPASGFEKHIPIPIQPDLIIYEQNQTLYLKNANDLLAKLVICKNYSELIDDNQFMRECVSHAKWLTDSLSFRTSTLEKIGQYILKTQQLFFAGIQSAPQRFTSAQLAEELGLSISTTRRALQHKYIDTPRGVFPLAYFTVRHQKVDTTAQALLHVIQTEDKQNPLSDREITERLKAQNLPISRRTVAKYRAKLNIPSCFARKIS